jgi:hypothetical protein
MNKQWTTVFKFPVWERSNKENTKFKRRKKISVPEDSYARQKNYK